MRQVSLAKERAAELSSKAVRQSSTVVKWPVKVVNWVSIVVKQISIVVKRVLTLFASSSSHCNILAPYLIVGKLVSSRIFEARLLCTAENWM